MSQSKEVKTEQARLRMQKMRNKGVTESPDNVTQSPESVTESVDSVTVDVTQYPALLYALVDPIKRRKLEKIYQSLKDFGQEKNVFYGYPSLMPFDVVGEYLEVTK